MKREELEKHGLTRAQVDYIMAEHGKDVEAHKAKTSAAEAELSGLKQQLGEAARQIEALQGQDAEGARQAAAAWQQKFEQAQAESTQIRFDHALETALAGAGARNHKSVRALLDTQSLALAEDGSLTGLSEQLEKLRRENDYLFAPAAEDEPLELSDSEKLNILWGAHPQLHPAQESACPPTAK
jgi:hypothetical protein